MSWTDSKQSREWKEVPLKGVPLPGVWQAGPPAATGGHLLRTGLSAHKLADLDGGGRSASGRAREDTHPLHSPCVPSAPGRTAPARRPDHQSFGLGAGGPRPGPARWGRRPARCRKTRRSQPQCPQALSLAILGQDPPGRPPARAVSLPGVQSLGQEDPLEEAMATHSSVLAWRIPWTEEPGSCSPWGRKESDTTERLNKCRARGTLVHSRQQPRWGKALKRGSI